MCPQTLPEHSLVLLKAPAVMEVHSECYEIWLIGWSYFGAAETSGQVRRRLIAVFPQQWFLGFHNHNAFRVSDSSLLQSQDSLHHNMACIIYLSLSIYLVDHGLQVHLPTRSITASKCISTLAWSRPLSVSPNLLNQGLQVHLWVTWSRPPSTSPNLLDHGLQGYLWVTRSRPESSSPNSRSSTASKCISNLVRLQPSSPSLSSLSHGLPVHLQTCSITASKCISTFTKESPPSLSLSSLDRHFRCTLNCSLAPPAASPSIPCVDG